MYFAIYQMYKLLTKYHNLIFKSTKILLSLVAVYYLWQHRHLTLLWQDYKSLLSIKFIAILLIFSVLNWFFEIKKWQYLAGHIQPVSTKEAAKQSFISFSLSLLTPNRVGEYGAKMLFFDSKHFKKLISLTLVGNFSQLFITIVAGFIALLYAFRAEIFNNIVNLQLITNKNIWLVFLLTAGLSIFGLIFKSLRKRESYLIKQTHIWWQSIGYAWLRYLIFSSQFVWLLLYFNVHYSPIYLYTGVSLVYLVAAFFPILAFMDWAIKGNAAIWIFSSLHIGSAIVLKIVALMWLGNFLLPFLIGLIWMWQSKTFKR